MSITMCVGLLANALIDPLVVGTIARFDVICPSDALRVETVGRACPWGHNVKKPSGAGGTTVTLRTCACAEAGMPQPLALTATSIDVTGGDPAGFRVSNTRHGVTVYSDSPPAAMGAK